MPNLNRYRVVKIWKSSPRTQATQWAVTLGPSLCDSPESVLQISPPVQRLCTARQRKLSRPHKAHCVSRTRKLLWRRSAQRRPKRSRVLTLQSVVCRLISHCSIHTPTLFFSYAAKNRFHWQKKLYVKNFLHIETIKTGEKNQTTELCSCCKRKRTTFLLFENYSWQYADLQTNETKDVIVCFYFICQRPWCFCPWTKTTDINKSFFCWGNVWNR